MKKDVSHIILTRFNLAVRFKRSRKDSEVPEEQPWLNVEYLEKRFVIFEKYTFPSIAAQTDKDFKWIVMFHKNTPQIFRDRIKSLAGQMEQMEIWYLDEDECMNLVAVIKAYMEKEYAGQNIITTRIDNDDMLHGLFVETVKKDVIPANEMQVVSYVNGTQYDSRCKVLLKYDYVDNHFLSLYAPAEKEKMHIMSCKHTRIDELILDNKMQKIVKRTEVPLWVEVITDTNCLNTPVWKFSSVFVPYEMSENYPMLEEWWKSRIQWASCIALGFVKVFYYRGINFIKIIVEKVLGK